jgi:hypothetical protein
MSKLAKPLKEIQRMNRPIPKGRAAKAKKNEAPKTYMLPKKPKQKMLPRVKQKMM